MEVLEAMRNRRAVRDYLPRAVAAPVLNQMISAACWAPSSMNDQPWQFTIVTDSAVLGEISSRAKSWLLDNVSLMPRPAHFGDILGDPEFQMFYNAPALVVISSPSDNLWRTEDSALAAQNMMLAAHALGLGTCWIGFAEAWLNTEEGLHKLDLSDAHQVVAPIIVGYPRAVLPPVPRKAATVTWIGPSISAQV